MCDKFLLDKESKQDKRVMKPSNTQRLSFKTSQRTLLPSRENRISRIELNKPPSQQYFDKRKSLSSFEHKSFVNQPCFIDPTHSKLKSRRASQLTDNTQIRQAMLKFQELYSQSANQNTALVNQKKQSSGLQSVLTDLTHK